jgi:hypothetical protein
MGLGIKFKKIWWIYPLFIIMFIILLKIVQKNWEDIMDKYEQVNTSTSVFGKIDFIKEYKSRSFIRLKNCNEYYLPWADNYNYQPPYLNRFINIGDSIAKYSGTDSLKIIRNKKEYVFVLFTKINN